MASSVEEAKAQVESAREEVVACEKEIQNIKGALRQLSAGGGGASGSGSGAGGDEEHPNSVEVSVINVEGLAEAAQPTFSLQLSSPVEEQTLTKLFDPLGPADEGSVAIFTGVETSMATLTVSVRDAEMELGASESHDMAPLCPLDATTPAPQYVSEIPVAIVSSGAAALEEAVSEESTPFEDAKEEIKDTEEEADDAGGVEESKEAEAESKKKEAVVVPVCVVTLRVTYKPSAKDQREELYDLLNKASQKKNRAIDELRQKAAAMSRASAGAPSTEITSRSQPAVKAGFLNKSSGKKKEPSKLVAWYNRTLGPESLFRQIIPVAKNYVIFFGAVALFHFKGQELALPPPV